jgi:hypothetical protein
MTMNLLPIKPILPRGLRWCGWLLAVTTLLYPMEAPRCAQITAEWEARERGAAPPIQAHSFAIGGGGIVHCGLQTWAGGIAGTIGIAWLLVAAGIAIWKVCKGAPWDKASVTVMIAVFIASGASVGMQAYLDHRYGFTVL